MAQRVVPFWEDRMDNLHFATAKCLLADMCASLLNSLYTVVTVFFLVNIDCDTMEIKLLQTLL